MFADTEHLRGRIPNALSVSRIVMSVPLAVGLYRFLTEGTSGRMVILILLMMLATDVLDGRLARRWRCTSDTGAVLDVAGDLLMALLSAIAMCAAEAVTLLVPFMEVLLIAQFFVTSRMSNDHMRLRYDMFGRMAGITFMLMPLAVVVIRLMDPNAVAPMTLMVVIAVTLSVASIVVRTSSIVARPTDP
ncbi:CDP-alcohol phosphatidyltransferase family protein [Candidatus Methanoprimaticola sp. MG2]|uniref:CDP-alcohol phosphatidyltransferase family protein n=1 Tax=Candidatus Methanoprimaticola sp. MG2 TaxID=3228838 RepID=UPI0039C710DB